MLVAQEGYDYCRGIAMFRVHGMRSGNLQHTSLHFHRYPPVALARHLLRHAHPRPWTAALTVLPAAGLDPLRLGKRLFDLAVADRGTFHLWAHSWELSADRSWRDFEALLEYVAGRRRVAYVTNAELFDALLQS
jgi:hypothetical protein